AAELGFEYGRDKEVTLLCGTPEILGGDSIAGSARSELGKLGVEIRTGTRVKGTRELEGGKTEVELEGGETIVVDLYLPTMGLVPNSEYIPARYLNDNKYVVVDDFFRVQDAEAVWAAGDIVSKPRAAFFHTQKQVMS
ncbi:MAG: FAD-dependent oxidoreductase, partial [Thaumarchaeota archaeon]|nr:FAD-dependent oxidoreductase [Nitrososphaerota archaeon]